VHTSSFAFRLVDTCWDSVDDPMKALRKRLESPKGFGQGDVAIATKFDLASTALLANHQGRGVRRIRRSDRTLKPVTVN
jgi:hypothetical protein